MEISDSIKALEKDESFYVRSDRTVINMGDSYMYDDQGLYLTVCNTAEDMVSYLNGNRDVPHATSEYDLDQMFEGEEVFFPWALEYGFKRLSWFKEVEVGSMTLSEAEAFLGWKVDVEENSPTQDFSGTIISAKYNDTDGILITVLDQDDDAWDIEAKHVTLSS
ncbi:MAG: hypothetical protein DRN14_07180 [Thermoplasmata archaeon]|nr:MAG: hypothetical protein DRN14_07180 [Thermoplasmata archaeon]